MLFSILLSLVILGIVLLIMKHYMNPSPIESMITYSKCSEYKNSYILEEIFNKYGVKQTFSSSPSLFIPCGYTTVEKQLQNLKCAKSTKIFAISGCDLLAGKNNLWISIRNCIGRKRAQKYLPNTYLLNDVDDIEYLISTFKSDSVYVLKKNIQRKQGIRLTNSLSEILNARKNGYILAQEYIKNLYLINKKNINIRLYMLIIYRKNKISWYLSTDGKCMYSNEDFNINGPIRADTYLTSSNVNPSIYNKNPTTLKGLKQYMGDKNYDILFNRIVDITKICKKCLNPKLYKIQINSNTSFQLFGLDFIFNTKFKPYLLEMNKGPQMGFVNKEDYQLKKDIYTDSLLKAGVLKDNRVKNSCFIPI